MLLKPSQDRRSLLETALGLGLLLAASLPSVHAASDTWDGSTDAAWAAGTNWVLDPAVAPGTVDTATFNNAGNGFTTIDLGGGVTIGALVFDTSNAAAYTIGSGASGSQTLTLGTTGNAIIMNSAVAANQVVNSNLALTVTRTAGNASTYYAVANHSLTNTLTLAGGVSASTSGVKVLNVTGAGNTNISGAIASGSGNLSLFKTGSGTLTLSGGATFSGNGVRDGANFESSAVIREGLTILNGGTYGNSGGELVVGGVATHGGAGTNATLQLNNGTTLSSISWLSIGRGNGNGTATSNLTLNGNASVSSTHLSAGYNAGNGGNLPKGTITLNGTSSLTVGGPNGEFHLGESGGSNFTMTLNNSSSVTLTGDSGNPARRYIGGSNGGTGGGTGVLTLNGTSTFTDQGAANSFNVGYQNGNGELNINSGTNFTTGAEIRVAGSNTNGTFSGSGEINVNGGTLNMAALTLARNNNDTASTFNATVNVTSGTVNVKTGQSLIGWRGTSSSGALNISGGSYNQGTTASANMVIGSFAGTTGAVSVSGTGQLNFQNNSNLRFSDVANANAARTLTISGGNVTFYGDAGGTVGGTGVIDLMVTSNPTGTNTIHLDGGTLTANQIKATSATGTRVINFNGGTLAAASSNAAFLASGVASTANVRNGGAIIDTNGKTVTIGQALVHSTMSGDDATDGGLTKNGAGTLTLTGTNSYNGATRINAGTLIVGVNGTGSITSNVSVAGGATLGGSGTIAGNITLAAESSSGVKDGGILAAGNSPGVLTSTGTTTLNAGSIFAWELASNLDGDAVDAGDTGSRGTDYDGLTSGALSVASGAIFRVILSGTADLDDSFWTQSQSWSDIFSVSGTIGEASLGRLFNAFEVYDGSTNITASSAAYGGFGFDGTTLTWSAVPEPGAALSGLLVAAGLLRRRRGS